MYRGEYFDGKSSTGFPCTINLTPNGIQIVYVGTDLKRNEVTWPIAGIHQGDYERTEKITLKFGDLPYQYLLVSNPQFYPDLTHQFPGKKFNSTDFEFFRTRGFAGILMVFAALMVAAVLFYVYGIPAIADRFAQFMPQLYEEQLGNSLYSKTLEDYDVDQPRTKVMNAFWRNMDYSTAYPVQITVVDENDDNAFAFPGGHIVVYNGILKHIRTEEQLVALLSHEYSHVSLRHTSRAIMRALSNYMFISVLFGDISGATAVAMQHADNLKTLHFSRELETQADDNGLALMQQHGFNPKGMLDLFYFLQTSHEETELVPRFLSTHPLTAERIAHVNAFLANHRQSSYTTNIQLHNSWLELQALNAEDATSSPSSSKPADDSEDGD
ncbi:MAG: M48 family metallopeptidase [Chitinophagales bacterium]